MSLLVATAAIAFATMFADQVFGQNRDEAVVTTGDAARDGDGTFSGFGDVNSFDDMSRIGFVGDFTGATGGASGIFLGNTDSLSPLMRVGDASSSGTITSFSSPKLNGSGTASFEGVVGGLDTTLKLQAEQSQSCTVTEKHHLMPTALSTTSLA